MYTVADISEETILKGDTTFYRYRSSLKFESHFIMFPDFFSKVYI